jgi:hypothetical protein
LILAKPFLVPCLFGSLLSVDLTLSCLRCVAHVPFYVQQSKASRGLEGGSRQYKATLVDTAKILDGECPNDDAKMDSADHFSTASKIKSQTNSADCGGTAAELTDAVAEKATTANTASSSVAADHEESIQISIGKLIQDLFHSDNAKVDAASLCLESGSRRG